MHARRVGAEVHVLLTRSCAFLFLCVFFFLCCCGATDSCPSSEFWRRSWPGEQTRLQSRSHRGHDAGVDHAHQASGERLLPAAALPGRAYGQHSDSEWLSFIHSFITGMHARTHARVHDWVCLAFMSSNSCCFSRPRRRVHRRLAWTAAHLPP